MSNQEEKLYDKIRKLLALGESPNEEEASLAIEKAHELLKKHNLSMDVLEMKKTEIKEGTYFEADSLVGWKSALLKMITRANYCDVLVRKSEAGDHFLINIIGREHNVVASSIMADYLFAVCDKLSNEKYPEEGASREGYLLGLSAGLQSRLRALKFKDSVTDSKALVIQSQEDIQEHLENLGAEESHIENPTLEDQEKYKAFVKGHQDALGVALNTQLS